MGVNWYKAADTADQLHPPISRARIGLARSQRFNNARGIPRVLPAYPKIRRASTCNPTVRWSRSSLQQLMPMPEAKPADAKLLRFRYGWMKAQDCTFHRG